MLLDLWDAIELDLHARYGVDVESRILAERTWAWLEKRILGLISDGGHLTRALQKRSA